MTRRVPSTDRHPRRLRQSSEAVAGGVRVLPAEEACDFEHVARRLLNPDLLTQSVAVAVFRLPLLAVPVGEGRRGGRAVVECAEVGEAMAAVLRGRAGFPGVRTRPASGGFAVEWGDTAPDCADSAERERFYGLTEPTAPPQDEVHRTIASETKGGSSVIPTLAAVGAIPVPYHGMSTAGQYGPDWRPPSLQAPVP